MWGTAPAGLGTGCLVHTAAHHSLAVDAAITNIYSARGKLNNV